MDHILDNPEATRQQGTRGNNNPIERRDKRQHGFNEAYSSDPYLFIIGNILIPLI